MARQIGRVPVSRRDFLSSTLVGSAALVAPHPASADPQSRSRTPGAFDPWLEIDREALRHNVRVIARLTSGRPVLVVAKNNAYGLGLATVGPILDPEREVWGFAVVRTDEAMALRDAGVKKPIVLMAPVSSGDLAELVSREVRVTPFDAALIPALQEIARRRSRPSTIQFYVDTGMSRLGIPVQRMAPLLEAATRARDVRVEAMFTELTEDAPFDREQVARLRAVADDFRRRGGAATMLHAASSAAVWHLPDAHLDLVRPGLGVYGGYVSAEAMRQGELKCAYRLRAPVMRMERLEPGEGVSYHRRWIAKEPTWIATLPVGHVDGYPSRSVDGGEVMIGDQLYPVIGTVSASHTILAIGAEPTVEVGDIATLVGGEHEAIHPNTVAKRASWSEYNMFMHLNPLLPRRVV
jgi:alanine racemase